MTLLIIMVILQKIGRHKGVLDAERIRKNMGLQCSHVATVDPDLPYVHIRGYALIAVEPSCRGPYMVRKL
jgi:hypothetical protein